MTRPSTFALASFAYVCSGTAFVACALSGEYAVGGVFGLVAVAWYSYAWRL